MALDRLCPGLHLKFTDLLSKEIGPPHWVGVLGSYDLPLGFTLTAAQQMFLTQFEQPLALFGPEPPSTRLWFSRLQVHNRLLQIGGFSPSLSFIRENRRANLTIYSYERYRAEGGFVRVF